MYFLNIILCLNNYAIIILFRRKYKEIELSINKSWTLFHAPLLHIHQSNHYSHFIFPDHILPVELAYRVKLSAFFKNMSKWLN